MAKAGSHGECPPICSIFPSYNCVRSFQPACSDIRGPCLNTINTLPLHLHPSHSCRQALLSTTAPIPQIASTSQSSVCSAPNRIAQSTRNTKITTPQPARRRRRSSSREGEIWKIDIAEGIILPSKCAQARRSA